MKNIEPLNLLLSKYKFEIDKIKSIYTGLRYTAVLLENGNIGVCANLGHKIESEINNYLTIDLNNFSHRIVINAYFAALLNYSHHQNRNVEIFQTIDFKKYKEVVMLGFIKPVAEKLQELNIPLNIFDFQQEDSILLPISEEKNFLKKADAVILSSTSIFNNSFLDSINVTNDNCDIFMIGPSSIMAPEILEYRNIKKIFGATFENADERVLKIISEGDGTRKFLKLENKDVLQ